MCVQYSPETSTPYWFRGGQKRLCGKFSFCNRGPDFGVFCWIFNLWLLILFPDLFPPSSVTIGLYRLIWVFVVRVNTPLRHLWLLGETFFRPRRFRQQIGFPVKCVLRSISIISFCQFYKCRRSFTEANSTRSM